MSAIFASRVFSNPLVSDKGFASPIVLSIKTLKGGSLGWSTSTATTGESGTPVILVDGALV